MIVVGLESIAAVIVVRFDEPSGKDAGGTTFEQLFAWIEVASRVRTVAVNSTFATRSPSATGGDSTAPRQEP